MEDWRYTEEDLKNCTDFAYDREELKSRGDFVSGDFTSTKITSEESGKTKEHTAKKLMEKFRIGGAKISVKADKDPAEAADDSKEKAADIAAGKDLTK